LTSWPFSFAGKISRAASRNKETVTAAALALPMPLSSRYGLQRDLEIRSGGKSPRDRGIDTISSWQGLVDHKVEIEELFHASTLDVAKI